jgi:V/A-type H+/Na+-transporting ATPase subunit D
MEKIALNKSSLQKVREHMRLCERLLPSLDLKRRQLTAELSRAKLQHEKAGKAIHELMESVGHKLPMLANREMPVSGLVKIKEVKTREENIAGVNVPVVEEVICDIAPYSVLVRRHWVDSLVDMLQKAARLKAEMSAAEIREERLEQGVRRITQRVNLFEKILIPESRRVISRIQIFLGDAERSAVVRSKISKQKNQAASEEIE